MLSACVALPCRPAALFVLTHNTHSISYLTATALAVELAVLNNFVWHQLWTWRDRPSLTLMRRCGAWQNSMSRLGWSRSPAIWFS